MHVNFCSKISPKQIAKVAEQDAKKFFPESTPIGKKTIETIQHNKQYAETMEAMKQGVVDNTGIAEKIEADRLAEAYRAAHGIK